MFYCNKCAKEKGFPQTAFISLGKCEICGVEAECHDTPSKELPLPQKEENLTEDNQAENEFNENFKYSDGSKSGRYQRLHDYLVDEHDIHLKGAELEELIWEAQKAGQVDENVGFKFERTKCKDNEREKAFYEEWQKENIPLSWINFGNGCLQDLFFEQRGTTSGEMFRNRPKMVLEINKRDRYIVATVIQWLGTNCGMGFLHAALNRCGLVITQKKK